MRRRLLAQLALALAPALLSGCVVLIRTTQGSIPSPAAIATIGEGATLAQVLERFGAPTESWRQPEGKLLIYRQRRYAFDRIGLTAPSRALDSIPVGQVVRSILGNLKLILELGSMREDRLAVLLDRDDRVTAVAYRPGEDDAPAGDEGARDEAGP